MLVINQNHEAVFLGNSTTNAGKQMLTLPENVKVEKILLFLDNNQVI